MWSFWSQKSPPLEPAEVKMDENHPKNCTLQAVVAPSEDKQQIDIPNHQRSSPSTFPYNEGVSRNYYVCAIDSCPPSNSKHTKVGVSGQPSRNQECLEQDSVDAADIQNVKIVTTPAGGGGLHTCLIDIHERIGDCATSITQEDYTTKTPSRNDAKHSGIPSSCYSGDMREIESRQARLARIENEHSLAQKRWNELSNKICDRVCHAADEVKHLGSL